MKKIAALLLVLSGCSPMWSTDIRDAIKNGSGCARAAGGVGGGAIVPTPAVPMTGGGGYVYVGHLASNVLGKVTITLTGCTIEHNTEPQPTQP